MHYANNAKAAFKIWFIKIIIDWYEKLFHDNFFGRIAQLYSHFFIGLHTHFLIFLFYFYFFYKFEVWTISAKTGGFILTQRLFVEPRAGSNWYKNIYTFKLGTVLTCFFSGNKIVGMSLQAVHFNFSISAIIITQICLTP